MQDRRSFCAGLAFAAALGAGARKAAAATLGGSGNGAGATASASSALARVSAFAARALPNPLLEALRRETRAPGAPRGAAALKAAAAADFRAGRTVMLGGVALSRTELGHWLAAAEDAREPASAGSAGTHI